MKLIGVIAAMLLVPEVALYGQESVCHLFSRLGSQTDGRQLVLTGDLVISKGIAVLGSRECDTEYISQNTVWPIALSLRPSEKLSASERREFQAAAQKIDVLREEGKVVNATGTFAGIIRVTPKGGLPGELIFNSFKDFAVEVLPDPATLPVIPICELFRDLRVYQERRIAVRGEYVTTMEGEWIVGRCQGTFITDGYRWPVALNFGRPADCSPETTKLCDATWPSKWPTNTEYMINGYSDGATTATFVGRLHMRSEYHAECMPNGWYSANGFGHLNGAVAELIVENILNAEPTPTRAKNENINQDSEKCVPSN